MRKYCKSHIFLYQFKKVLTLNIDWNKCASRVLLAPQELGNSLLLRKERKGSKEFPLPVEPDNGYLAINDKHKQQYASIIQKMIN